MRHGSVRSGRIQLEWVLSLAGKAGIVTGYRCHYPHSTVFFISLCVQLIGVVIMQMAQLYDKDPDYAGFMAVVTIVCSVVTLPGLIWV